MTSAYIEIGSLIERAPHKKEGRPMITGTGVTVRRIVLWYKLGLTPEEIIDRMGHPNLNLAKIYAALTYYHANTEEIEADLAKEEAEAKTFEKHWLEFDSNRYAVGAVNFIAKYILCSKINLSMFKNLMVKNNFIFKAKKSCNL